MPKFPPRKKNTLNSWHRYEMAKYRFKFNFEYIPNDEKTWIKPNLLFVKSISCIITRINQIQSKYRIRYLAHYQTWFTYFDLNLIENTFELHQLMHWTDKYRICKDIIIMVVNFFFVSSCQNFPWSIVHLSVWLS